MYVLAWLESVQYALFASLNVHVHPVSTIPSHYVNDFYVFVLAHVPLLLLSFSVPQKFHNFLHRYINCHYQVRKYGLLPDLENNDHGLRATMHLDSSLKIALTTGWWHYLDGWLVHLK